MQQLIDVIGGTLMFSFVLCCVFSGLLQLRAWSRHAREGVTVSLRALRHPEGYFDEIGLRQMRIARRLLSIGAVAYLSYGVLLVVTSALRS